MYWLFALIYGFIAASPVMVVPFTPHPTSCTDHTVLRSHLWTLVSSIIDRVIHGVYVNSSYSFITSHKWIIMHDFGQRFRQLSDSSFSPKEHIRDEWLQCWWLSWNPIRLFQQIIPFLAPILFVGRPLLGRNATMWRLRLFRSLCLSVVCLPRCVLWPNGTR